MTDRSGKRMAVFGMSGSGKTYYVKNKILPGFDRVVVFDPEDEFSQIKGFIRVDNLDAFCETLEDCWNGNFKVAFVPGRGDRVHKLSEISATIERMQEAYRLGWTDKKVTLIVDELNQSFPLQYSSKEDGFAVLCSSGRKRGVNIIGITQRPAEISTRFRGNCDRYVVFDLFLPADIKAVCDTIGPDVEPALRGLAKRQFIDWADKKFTVSGPT